VAFPCSYPAEWRAIRFGATSIRLVAGGQLVRQIPFAGAGRAVGLDEISAVIDDPSWIGEVEPGVFLLRAALVQTDGTQLDVRAPRVTTVRLADLPVVSLSGNRSSASFSGVTVTSWNEAANAPDTSVVDERPYVRYQNGGRLDISGSRFEDLGSDRTSSYGVVWRLGTTGLVTDSSFQRNFFGIYTYEAVDVRFERNVVADNVRYGIDPHDNSSGLVFVENEVYGNGSHGIIFSRFVHDSVVRANYSHDNAGNGIMMDEHSDRNLIEDNVVTDNGREGIVSASSADLTIRRNTISGSEVGVRISHQGADRVLAEGNAISHVATGVYVYDRAMAATIRDNDVSDASVAGMHVAAPGAQLLGNDVVRAPVGVDARNAVTISGGELQATDRALDVSANATVFLSEARLVARDRAIRVAPGGVVTRSATSVQGGRGGSALGGDDFRLLSLIGLALVGIAIALQVTSTVRNRRTTRRVAAPAHVRNVM
jgi:parallel beta-helix repeat protein